ncbi:MAG: Eco57I restriction-modification methylase domain-containing protein, partial [Candidatus Helarchaeales archaeon]
MQGFFREMGIHLDNKAEMEILAACLGKLLEMKGLNSLSELMALDLPILEKFSSFTRDDLDYLNSKIKDASLDLAQCQRQVQFLLPQAKRKSLAAYYTTDQGLELMKHLLKKHFEMVRNDEIVACDPFLGSGRTLTALLEQLGLGRIKIVWGIEPHYLSALVAFTALSDRLEGDFSRVVVINGNAFHEIPRLFSLLNDSHLPKADIILTNPPYTRWKHVAKSERKKLIQFVKDFGHDEYLTRKETGLQIFSMFLCDLVLKKNGLVIAVLPLSSFYTLGGRGYKNMLKKKYSVLSLVESSTSPSFSIDSSFKEVILVAQKEKRNVSTLFASLGNNFDALANDIIHQGTLAGGKRHFLDDLPAFLDNNWLSLFPTNNDVQDLIIEFLKQGLKAGYLDYWNSILGKEVLARGFEMYGPDFFFIPNKYWEIINENEEHVEIFNSKSRLRLKISKRYLVRALWKPSLNYKTIIPRVINLAFSIPPVHLEELPDDLRRYVNWGVESKVPLPAMRSFGEFWYSHVHECLKTKQPYGYLFLSDKV